MKGNAAESNPSAAVANLMIRTSPHSDGPCDCDGSFAFAFTVGGELMDAKTLCLGYTDNRGRFLRVLWFHLPSKAIPLSSRYVSTYFIQNIRGKWFVSSINRRPDYLIRLDGYPGLSLLPLLSMSTLSSASLEFEIHTPRINPEFISSIVLLAVFDDFTNGLIRLRIHRPLTNPTCFEPSPAVDDLVIVIRPSALHTDPDHGRDWANIPNELLISDIAKHLSVIDYIRLAAACKCWFYAAKSLRPHPTLQKKPYLMIFPENRPYSAYLYDLPNNKVAHVIDALPEIAGKWCVGSQQGRLILLDEFSNISVLHPLTASYIRLPEITTLPGVIPVYDPNGSSLVAYHYCECGDHSTKRTLYKINAFRESIAMKKVVFSRDFTTAVAIFGLDYEILAYLRPGDCKWTTIDTWDCTGKCESVLDIMCWGSGGGDDGNGGCFLVVFSGGLVFSLDITGPSAEMTRIGEKIGDFYADLPNQSDRYLVDISGVIMQVCRMYANGRTTGFTVWRLDLLSSTWTRVDNLGDYSLFVGSCYSMPFLTTTDAAFGFRSNCIYFTDVLHGLVGYDGNGTEDMGIYSMCDTSFQRFSYRDRKFMRPVPVWIVPFRS